MAVTVTRGRAVAALGCAHDPLHRGIPPNAALHARHLRDALSERVTVVPVRAVRGAERVQSHVVAELLARLAGARSVALAGPRAEAVRLRVNALVARLEDVIEKGEHEQVARLADEAVAALGTEPTDLRLGGILVPVRQLRKKALAARAQSARRALDERVAKKDYAAVPALAEKAWAALRRD